MRQGRQKFSAVFLDRDGVITRDVDHLRSKSQLRLLPGAARAIRRLNDAGLRVIVVTNQSAIARGWLSPEKLDEIHAELRRRLAKAGAHLDAVYVCPHHPTEGSGALRRACRCRKPNPGMLLRAARELGLSLPESAMIGDKLSDLEAGRRAGCATALVLSGQGREALRRIKSRSSAGVADVICSCFPRAVDWCLQQAAES
jgi:D-glycero-D-manno-heptose 1,7-bisphosphate phosphatase